MLLLEGSKGEGASDYLRVFLIDPVLTEPLSGKPKPEFVCGGGERYYSFHFSETTDERQSSEILDTRTGSTVLYCTCRFPKRYWKE